MLVFLLILIIVFFVCRSFIKEIFSLVAWGFGIFLGLISIITKILKRLILNQKSYKHQDELLNIKSNDNIINFYGSNIELLKNEYPIRSESASFRPTKISIVAGILLLTNKRLFFQPFFHSNIFKNLGKRKLYSWNLENFSNILESKYFFKTKQLKFVSQNKSIAFVVNHVNDWLKDIEKIKD